MGLVNKVKSIFSKEIVGLDIGDDTVKLAEIESSWGKIILNNYSIIETPTKSVKDGQLKSMDEITEKIRETLIEKDFEGNEVIAAISGEEVISRTIEVPHMPADELGEAIKWEAEDHIPVPIDEVIIDYEILSEGEGDKYELMIIAVKKELVEKYIQLCEELGLEIKAIEIEPMAIARTISKLYQDNTIGTIDIGEKATSVSVINQGRLLFTRTIGIGGADVNNELMENKNLTSQEAEKYKRNNNLLTGDDELIILDNLITGIYRSFDYFQVKHDGYNLDRIILTGGGSRLKNIVNYLSEEFDEPVEALDLDESLVAANDDIEPEELANIGQLLAVSIGLALRKEEDNDKLITS